jgi:hypothetical protein
MRLYKGMINDNKIMVRPMLSWSVCAAESDSEQLRWMVVALVD